MLEPLKFYLTNSWKKQIALKIYKYNKLFNKKQIMKKSIFVTQPYLPSLEEFIPYLQEIWDNKVITNGGPFHQQLEYELCKYLGVKYISLFSNGTIALITALQTLGIEGEVITTPYSFVATAHSLLWNKNTPVFVDIEPETLNIDPSKIESAITEKTKAIMPVLCYGNPCEFEEIKRIAEKYKLKIIYDAAHAFGVNHESKSILINGDLSILSFHATKVFNTFEGGAIISSDIETKKRIDQLKNFGFTSEITVQETGINGKMSEINAAFGLLQLKHVEKAIFLRRQVAILYNQRLKNIKGLTCIPQKADKANYSYFPIIVDLNFKITRDELYFKLKEKNINSRRYFYPLISNFEMYKKYPSSKFENLPIATKAANEVICLPIYPDLTENEVNEICDYIEELS